jgi:hypothetical protein
MQKKSKLEEQESMERVIKIFYERGYLDSAGRYRKQYFPSLWEEDYYIGPIVEMPFKK